MSDAKITVAGATDVGPVDIRRIGPEDIGIAIRRGWADFAAKPSHIILLVVLYPVLGLLFSRAAAGYNLLSLLFPLISGFALVGPIAALGLYEISRRRESGQKVAWSDAFRFVRSPAVGAIATLSGALALVYVVWLFTAFALFRLVFGGAPPVSVSAFLHDVFTTPEGWALIVLGCGVGFAFALLVLAVGSISFPMLIDRNVGAATAVRTSIAAFRANPTTMLLWGATVAAGLIVGSLPAFLGLVVVLPVLGHATWHLYRQVVRR